MTINQTNNDMENAKFDLPHDIKIILGSIAIPLCNSRFTIWLSSTSWQMCSFMILWK